jgi:hypothetical protein
MKIERRSSSDGFWLKVKLRVVVCVLTSGTRGARPSGFVFK